MVQITTPGVEPYAEAHTTAHSPKLDVLFTETHEGLDGPGMLTGPVEGRFLQMLVFALQARRVLEIGTYSGYSALSMAEGMPVDGRIITCEIDPVHADFARRHFDDSRYGPMIDIRVGPALETIESLAEEMSAHGPDQTEPVSPAEVGPNGGGGLFDFVFIDADKEHYPDYFEAVLPLLAPRGLIAADNTLWSGRVFDATDRHGSTEALRVFNDRVASDPRVVAVMLTVRDGVTLIRHA